MTAPAWPGGCEADTATEAWVACFEREHAGEDPHAALRLARAAAGLLPGEEAGLQWRA